MEAAATNIERPGDDRIDDKRIDDDCIDDDRVDARLRLGERVEGADGTCWKDARFCLDEDDINPAPMPRMV